MVANGSKCDPPVVSFTIIIRDTVEIRYPTQVENPRKRGNTFSRNCFKKLRFLKRAGVPLPPRF